MTEDMRHVIEWAVFIAIVVAVSIFVLCLPSYGDDQYPLPTTSVPPTTIVVPQPQPVPLAFTGGDDGKWAMVGAVGAATGIFLLAAGSRKKPEDS